MTKKNAHEIKRYYKYETSPKSPYLKLSTLLKFNIFAYIRNTNKVISISKTLFQIRDYQSCLNNYYTNNIVHKP